MNEVLLRLAVAAGTRPRQWVLRRLIAGGAGPRQATANRIRAGAQRGIPAAAASDPIRRAVDYILQSIRLGAADDDGNRVCPRGIAAR